MARKKKEEVKLIESKSTNDNILLPNKVEMNDVKKELKDYVDEKVDKVFFDELRDANKKLIREKSRRIFWKNIIIIILIAIIGFLVYLLYSNNYFDKYFNKNSNNIEQKEEKKEESREVKPTPTPTPVPTPKKPTQDELKKEYGSLLDNYYVTDSSSYLTDFYEGNLTKDLKKYMTLNTFTFDKLEKEEDYNIIKESTFKEAYLKLFSDDYVSETFSYDENKIRYVKAMESYMTTELLVREDNNIEREIKDIKVDGNEIIITTVEGVVKDNKLYNILSNSLVEEYNEDSLLKYEDKLNKLIYTFKDSKLINLSK